MWLGGLGLKGRLEVSFKWWLVIVTAGVQGRESRWWMVIRVGAVGGAHVGIGVPWGVLDYTDRFIRTLGLARVGQHYEISDKFRLCMVQPYLIFV